MPGGSGGRAPRESADLKKAHKRGTTHRVECEPTHWICNVLAWVVPTLILQWPAIFRRETTPKQNTKALPSEQNLQNFVS